MLDDTDIPRKNDTSPVHGSDTSPGSASDMSPSAGGDDSYRALAEHYVSAWNDLERAGLEPTDTGIWKVADELSGGDWVIYHDEKDGVWKVIHADDAPKVVRHGREETPLRYEAPRLFVYRCPYCGGLAYQNDPIQGGVFIGYALCSRCGRGFSILGKNPVETSARSYAAQVAIQRYAFDANEKRDEKGEWTAGGESSGTPMEDDSPSYLDRIKGLLGIKTADQIRKRIMDAHYRAQDKIKAALKGAVEALEKHAPQNDLKDMSGRRIERALTAGMELLERKFKTVRGGHDRTYAYLDEKAVDGCLASPDFMRQLSDAAAKAEPSLHGSVVRALDSMKDKRVGYSAQVAIQRYAAKRVPKGYVVNKDGRVFRAGTWVSEADLSSATPVSGTPATTGGATAEADKQAAYHHEKRRARGPVDRAKLAEKTAPHAHQVLSEAEGKHAKRTFNGLHQHHGDLTAHRVEELVNGAHEALQNVHPDDELTRERLSKRMRGYHEMLSWLDAKKGDAQAGVQKAIDAEGGQAAQGQPTAQNKIPESRNSGKQDTPLEESAAAPAPEEPGHAQEVHVPTPWGEASHEEELAEPVAEQSYAQQVAQQRKDAESPSSEDDVDLWADPEPKLSDDEAFAKSWDEDIRGDGETPADATAEKPAAEKPAEETVATPEQSYAAQVAEQRKNPAKTADKTPPAKTADGGAHANSLTEKTAAATSIAFKTKKVADKKAAAEHHQKAHEAHVEEAKRHDGFSSNEDEQKLRSHHDAAAHYHKDMAALHLTPRKKKGGKGNPAAPSYAAQVAEQRKAQSPPAEKTAETPAAEKPAAPSKAAEAPAAAPSKAAEAPAAAPSKPAVAPKETTPPTEVPRGVKGKLLTKLASAKNGLSLEELRASLGEQGQHADEAVKQLAAIGKLQVEGNSVTLPKEKPYAQQVAEQRKEPAAKKGPHGSSDWGKDFDAPKDTPKDIPKQNIQNPGEDKPVAEKPVDKAPAEKPAEPPTKPAEDTSHPVTPASKQAIKNDPAYQAAVKAYADAPADKKDEARAKMKAAQDAANRKHHEANPVSPEEKAKKDAESAAAGEAHAKRPKAPMHVEHGEAYHDHPAEEPAKPLDEKEAFKHGLLPNLYPFKKNGVTIPAGAGWVQDGGDGNWSLFTDAQASAMVSKQKASGEKLPPPEPIPESYKLEKANLQARTPSYAAQIRAKMAEKPAGKKFPAPPATKVKAPPLATPENDPLAQKIGDGVDKKIAEQTKMGAAKKADDARPYAPLHNSKERGRDPESQRTWHALHAAGFHPNQYPSRNIAKGQGWTRKNADGKWQTLTSEEAIAELNKGREAPGTRPGDAELVRDSLANDPASPSYAAQIRAKMKQAKPEAMPSVANRTKEETPQPPPAPAEKARPKSTPGWLQAKRRAYRP